MSQDEEAACKEIIIVRRRGGDGDDGHHGGAWKIAYADFMTAMMAFFLVMWLVNASNADIRAMVASYFSPLKLTDAIVNPKGIESLEAGARGDADEYGNAPETSGDKKTDHENKKGWAKFTEEELISDPYGVLAELAAQALSKTKATERGDESLASGEAFRDPFDPEKWVEPEPAESKVAEPNSDADPADVEQVLEPELEQDNAPFKAPSATEGADADELSQRKTGEAVADPPPSPSAVEEKVADEAAERAKVEQQRRTLEAATLGGEIQSVVAKLGLKDVPDVNVTLTSEGLLISLTDKWNFGMFASASAKPRPELVLAMEKIAALLSKRNEPIVVRGHTDGRPFKSGSYDNWRLSAARAHMSYMMLVRAGVVKDRFHRIEGHADRRLLVGDDPGAARNRRIEILLERAGT